LYKETESEEHWKIEVLSRHVGTVWYGAVTPHRFYTKSAAMKKPYKTEQFETYSENNSEEKKKTSRKVRQALFDLVHVCR